MVSEKSGIGLSHALLQLANADPRFLCYMFIMQVC